MGHLLGLASLGLMIAGGGSAHAQADGTLRIDNPKAVETVLKDLGADILRKQAEDGRAMLGVKLEGHTFAVTFSDCTGGQACKGLRFLAYGKADERFTVERANAWNLSKLYLKVMVDEDGDTLGSMDIPTGGPVSTGFFADLVATWIASIEAFLAFKEGQ